MENIVGGCCVAGLGVGVGVGEPRTTPRNSRYLAYQNVSSTSLVTRGIGWTDVTKSRANNDSILVSHCTVVHTAIIMYTKLSCTNIRT